MMKEINIQEVLYKEFKKVEGKIAKLTKNNSFWLIKKVYLSDDGFAKINFNKLFYRKEKMGRRNS